MSIVNHSVHKELSSTYILSYNNLQFLTSIALYSKSRLSSCSMQIIVTSVQTVYLYGVPLIDDCLVFTDDEHDRFKTVYRLHV